LKEDKWCGIGHLLHTLKKREPAVEGSSHRDSVYTKDDREGSSGSLSVYWPEDLLKEDFAQARIMTFGYDTKITRGFQAASQGNIFSHARNLLGDLEQSRRKAADRPLVFLAHSLGGILVKEVLRRSEHDPDVRMKRIFRSTSGVFFFGTPHRGSPGWAELGEGVARVASFVLGVDVNDQIIHALLPSSAELELGRESFMTQWVSRGDKLTVRTFQESKGVTGIRRAGLSKLVSQLEKICHFA
jgi:hypothetical protein